ncbi:MAG: TraK family protein [Balneolaceae bacterium]|nr:TraK family protein [Balneolaceae bacterium]
MEKLSDRIKKRMESADRQERGGKSRVEFFNNQDDIAEALEAGWSSRAIHDTLTEEGKVSMSYDMFCRYVRQHIKKIKPKTVKNKPIVTSSKEKGFHWNPTPNPDELF